MADEIAAALLADPATPDYVREPSYAEAVMAWAEAVAECRRLRARRDELDRLDAEDPDAALIELTETTEDEVRPSMGTMRRVSRTRQRESLSRALHRAEMRARALRNDLGLSPSSRARLGADIASAKADAARYWAERWEQKKTAGGEGA